MERERESRKERNTERKTESKKERKQIKRSCLIWFDQECGGLWVAHGPIARGSERERVWHVPQHALARVEFHGDGFLAALYETCSTWRHLVLGQEQHSTATEGVSPNSASTQGPSRSEPKNFMTSRGGASFVSPSSRTQCERVTMFLRA